MRRSGLFTPKPAVPAVSKATAQRAEHSRKQLKEISKAELTKEERRVLPVGPLGDVGWDGAAGQSKLPISTGTQKEYQNGEPPFKHPVEKLMAVTLEVLEDDYADDSFEVYEDDFEESSKVVCALLRTVFTHLSSGDELHGLPSSYRDEGSQDREDSLATEGTESTGCFEQHVAEEETTVRKFQLTKMANMRPISFKIYSQAPISLPELFRMGCGPAARLAVAVTQTNDDACSLTSQTAKVARVDVHAQVPRDACFLSAAGVFRSSISMCINSYSTSQQRLSSALEMAEDIQLRHLLANVAHVLQALRPVGLSSDATSLSDVVGGNSEFCDGYVDLYWKETVMGRSVVDVVFQTGTSLLLCCYTRSQEQQTRYANQGCICIWDIVQPRQPQRLLVLEGIPNCVAWAMPVRSEQHSMVVRGTDAGSLCLWEVSGAKFLDGLCDDQSWPTYTTTHQLRENHQAPICSISSMSATGFKHPLPTGRYGKSSQIVSLDTLGKIIVWATKAVSSGAHSNHGLRPGGCVSLIKTAEISILGPSAGRPEFQIQGATHLSIFPEYSHQLLVGTENGLCIRTALVGFPEAPRKYSIQSEMELLPPAICSSFSPFLEECFLVAYGDGRLALYTASQSLPLRCWVSICNEKIISVQWSPHVPSEFFVLHSSKVLLWNLLESSGSPSANQCLRNFNWQGFCCNSSKLCFPVTRRYSGRRGRGQGPPKTAMAIGCLNGHTQVHHFHSNGGGKESGDLIIKTICQAFPQIQGKKLKCE